MKPTSLLTRTLSIALCAAVSCLGQNKTEVTAPRPVYGAIEKLQALTKVPINYEDLRYDYANDVEDASSKILTTEQRTANPKAKIMIPRSGILSATIAMDANDKTLSSLGSARAALNAILAAQTDLNTPGKLRADSFGEALFVEPTQQHSSRGATVAVTPVLSTRVTVDAKDRNGVELLENITAQIRTGAGVKVMLGTMPLNAFISTQLTFTANGEPAKYTLARLLSAVFNGRPAAYHMLYDPAAKSYVLNVSAL